MKETIGYTLLIIAIYMIGFLNGATIANNKWIRRFNSIIINFVRGGENR